MAKKWKVLPCPNRRCKKKTRARQQPEPWVGRLCLRQLTDFSIKSSDGKRACASDWHVTYPGRYPPEKPHCVTRDSKIEKTENTEQRTPPRPNNGPYIVQAKTWELKVDPGRTLSSGILLAIARALSRWRVHGRRCAMVKLMSE